MIRVRLGGGTVCGLAVIQAPYRQKLRLAIDVRTKSTGDLAVEMTSRIGLTRLKQTTCVELDQILKDAQSVTRKD